MPLCWPPGREGWVLLGPAIRRGEGESCLSDQSDQQVQWGLEAAWPGKPHRPTSPLIKDRAPGKLSLAQPGLSSLEQWQHGSTDSLLTSSPCAHGRKFTEGPCCPMAGGREWPLHLVDGHKLDSLQDVTGTVPGLSPPPPTAPTHPPRWNPAQLGLAACGSGLPHSGHPGTGLPHLRGRCHVGVSCQFSQGTNSPKTHPSSRPAFWGSSVTQL